MKLLAEVFLNAAIESVSPFAKRKRCQSSGGGKGKGPLLFPLVISGEKWTRLLLSRAIFSQIIPASISPLWWHFEGQWSSKTSSALYDSHGASGDTLTEPVPSAPALSYSFLWTVCRLLPGRTETDSCMFKTRANPSCLKNKNKKNNLLYDSQLVFLLPLTEGLFTEIQPQWAIQVSEECVSVCVKGRGRETMRTEIRGYLFSIRMFQVRQASDDENRGTNKRKRRKEEGGGGSVAVSLLHITVSMLKASLFSKESQNVSFVKRDAHTRTARRKINHVQDRYILKHQFRATWGSILISRSSLDQMLRGEN